MKPEIVMYVFGCSSSLLLSVLTELFSEGQEFQVVVVGSRTHDDGLKMLRSLTQVGISCTYILVNQANFIMPQVHTKSGFADRQFFIKHFFNEFSKFSSGAIGVAGR